MKRTLTLASIALLLEEMDYEFIHLGKEANCVVEIIGNFTFIRRLNNWELEKINCNKKQEVVDSESLLTITDSFYHDDVANIMMTAINNTR